jgi:site-specific recombinase XerD
LRVREYCIEYGLALPSLRRAFASHLLNGGASIEQVMAVGCWRSYDAVKRYAYLNDKSKKASFRTMDSIL